MSDLSPSSFLRNSRVAMLEAIRRHYADFGAAPSYEEIGHRVGLDRRRVGAVLSDLERDGYIVLEHVGTRQRRPRLVREPLANHSTSELLLELQARGMMAVLTPNGSPLRTLWRDPERS